MPNVFFIIRKLLKTDETASPIFPPTIGMNVPDAKRIPFITILSEELANRLCVVNIPVNTVENKDSIIVIIFLIVLSNLIWNSSAENDDIMFKENSILITGINNLSAKNEMILDNINEKELYVIARFGLLDAIIIPVITGRYVCINIVDVLIHVAASESNCPIDSITNEKINKMHT